MSADKGARATARKILKTETPLADSLQELYDNEDVLLALYRVKDCIAAKDAADMEVRRLNALLRAARRKQREAGWNMSAATHQVLLLRKKETDPPAS